MMLVIGTAQLFLFGLNLCNGSLSIHLQTLGQQRRLRGIAAIKDATVVERSQFDSSMDSRRGGTTYHDRYLQAMLLEQAAQLLHLLQRRGDESADTHQTGFTLQGLL